MTDKRFLFLEPLDFTFFRTPRPFFAAEVLTAQGTFPLPQAIYGAIRSMILLDPDHGCRELETFGRKDGCISCTYASGCRIPGLMGTPDNRGILGLKGPVLARRTDAGRLEAWFPAPRVLVRVGRDLDVLRPAQIPENDPLSDKEADDLNLAILMTPHGTEYEKLAGGDHLVSAGGLTRILKGRPPERNQVKPLKELFCPEPRAGVALRMGAQGCERTVEPSHLYTVCCHRPAPGTGFLVELDGIEHKDMSWPAVTFMGGERRAAAVHSQIDEAAWLPEPEVTSHRLRLCLVTPAIFKTGWVPEWLVNACGPYADPVPLPERLGGGTARVRLVSAVVGPPVAVGGFQMALLRKKNGFPAQRGPRPIRLAVPAGSTYDIEIMKGDATRVAEAVFAQGLSEQESEAGFGVTVVGHWEPVTIGGKS
jgi:CRISPR type III-B/RAMP module-associated protein Cmr3